MMRYLLSMGVMLGLGGAAWAQDARPQFRFHKGDAVRINCLDPKGMPIPSAICKTTDELEAGIERSSKSIRTGETVSPEGMVGVGHNTPAIVIDVALIQGVGSRVEADRVTLNYGTLKGQAFWVTSRRLRPADEPDPAKPRTPSSVHELSWDPGYRPAVGDSVVLAYKNPATFGMASATLIPKDSDEDSFAPGDGNCLRLAGGTRATVIDSGGILGHLIEVRVTSGPFVGQVGFTSCTQSVRPEVFERVAAGKVAATRRRPSPRLAWCFPTLP
jgi:hypothetical protein